MYERVFLFFFTKMAHSASATHLFIFVFISIRLVFVYLICVYLHKKVEEIFCIFSFWKENEKSEQFERNRNKCWQFYYKNYSLDYKNELYLWEFWYDYLLFLFCQFDFFRGNVFLCFIILIETTAQLFFLKCFLKGLKAIC